MDNFGWWTELTHGGLLISTPVLQEMFTEIKASPDNWQYRRLRDHYNSFRSKEASHNSGTHPVHDWLTNLFEDFLGYDPLRWLKGADIPKTYSILSKMGQLFKPRRVLVDENNEPILLLQTDASPRLGMHKGRRSYAQFVELLRKANVPLGILSNGHQIRLVYAGLDHDAWTQWQVDAWFDEGEIRHQLDGFVTLLNPKALEVQDGTFHLHQAVTLSRSRQADLSEVLGGQIRQAVEILTSALGRTKLKDKTFLDVVQITPLSEIILSEKDVLNAVYLAATRLVMRIVVLFFAEAKNLLPKDNPFYLDNYSLEGLYSNLRAASQHAGESEIETRYSAWPRFLALSRLVHTGSAHEILPLNAYGGSLFKPGSANHRDPVVRALSLFEDPAVQISDQKFYSILRLVKIGRTKVRQGRSSTWVSGPVDFNDLRTEYIGMMYEGLLDYELKIVEKDSPKIILNIGNQPILPLVLLESFDEPAIKNLFEKMKENKRSSSESEEETPLEPEIEEEAEKEAEVEESEEIPDDNQIHVEENSTYGRALSWAIKAIEAARLIRRPGGGGIALQQYEEKKLTKARSLLIKVLEPGEMYLVRWGGTRKGTGTFYTKPALAVPTTWRTLEPLVYDSKSGEHKVKPPQDILSLKICDPGVGSGTFLVAAARYLTEALYESLLIHILTNKDENGQITKVPRTIPISSGLTLEPPPIPPNDEGWEDQMKARLKRLVVEHCLYGVDLNGMAVELARVSLWLETMDKELPFEFLDHRIKQGNALVGTWFSQFLNYPAKAWERQDGTGSDKQNKSILRNHIKPELVRMISHPGQFSLYTQEELPEMTLNRQLEYWKELTSTQLFDTEKREQIFQDKIENDPSFLRLKHQFDRWCSVWFWPSEDKSKPILSPLNFFNEDDKINDIVNDLKSNFHFFHWELEFPEVFVKHDPNNKKTGFDIIIGNPAWDIQKPNSQEFFSNFDPIYRTYGKQEALRKQQQMFEGSSDIEKQWLAYSAGFKAMSNYVRNSNAPYDISLARGRANDELRRGWESIRKSQKAIHCLETPYGIQGGADLNLYKLFLEQSFHLMKPEGRIGMIIPSGIYTDKGSTELRKYFLHSADWEWLFAFDNKEKIFDIHRSYKFGPLILTKGGKTESVKCAFMRHDVRDWESQNPSYIVLPVKKIERFSPNTLSFMEFKSDIDLQICEKIYGDRPLLGDQGEGGWNVKFATEFHMTNDSHLFTSRKKLEKMGLLSPEDDARDPRVRATLWKKGISPLWEGYLIYQHDTYYNESPRNFIERNQINSFQKLKWGWRDVARSTDQRTFIAAKIPITCSGNTIWTVYPKNFEELSIQVSLVNTFTIDYIARLKQSGYHLLKAVVLTIPIPIKKEMELFPTNIWKINEFTNPKERLKKRIIQDVLVASICQFDINEFEYILSIFPLIDKNLPFKQRQTTLTLEAFKHLKQVGLLRFLEEGWELPDCVTEFDRPGIKIWEPEGGWEKAWAEAKAMLTEEEWIEFISENEQAQNTQKPHAVHEKPEKYGQKKLEFD